MTQKESDSHKEDTMIDLPKGLVINFDFSKCPDPVFVDDIQGGVTPSGLLNLSLYFDCPDYPKTMKSKETVVSDEGNITFEMPDDSSFFAEEQILSFTRRVGANVIMPKHTAHRLRDWLTKQLESSE